MKIDWNNVGLGEKSDTAISIEIGVSRGNVSRHRREMGIPVFSGYLLTQEGYNCRSVYEAMYDAHLHHMEIDHKHEVRIKETNTVADFVVGGRVIEIAGMVGYQRYDERFAKKKSLYRLAGIHVEWLYASDVKEIYKDCPLKIIAVKSRICSVCGEGEHDLVKGMCRNCYMTEWHRRNSIELTCDYCGEKYYSDVSSSKYCCIEHYWKAETFEWPAWEELSNMMNKKSIRQIAFDLGRKPQSLYMRIRRRKERNNGNILQ